MSANAILVIGNPVSTTANPRESCGGVGGLLSPSLLSQEVGGESVLERTIGRLQNAGIRDVSLVADGNPVLQSGALLRKYRNLKVIEGRADRWFAQYNRHRARSAETTLVLKLRGYLEFDAAEFLAFHRENHSTVTRARHDTGPLDLWAVSIPADGQPELNLSWLMHSAHSPAYHVRGYAKDFNGPRDLRQLAVDLLSGRCAARPLGREVRPGVWLASGARLHSRARVVAPAYIGAGTAVGAYAVITRCSNVERHCDIGPGTYIAGSSIFSDTRIGRGLFVSQSMVNGNGLWHLRRNTLVKVADGRLLGRTVAALEVEGPMPEHPAQAQPRIIRIKPQPRVAVAESCSMGLLEDEG